MDITAAEAKMDSKDCVEQRKRAGVPEVDPDALPSSYCAKFVACLGKRIKKLAAVQEPYTKADKLGKLDEIQTRSLGSWFMAMCRVSPNWSFSNPPILATRSGGLELGGIMGFCWGLALLVHDDNDDDGGEVRSRWS